MTDTVFVIKQKETDFNTYKFTDKTLYVFASITKCKKQLQIIGNQYMTKYPKACLDPTKSDDEYLAFERGNIHTGFIIEYVPLNSKLADII